MTKMAESARAARLPARSKSTSPLRTRPPRHAGANRINDLQHKAGNRAVNSLLLEAEQMAERTADRLVGASGAGLGEPTMPQPIENPSVKLREEGSPLPQTVKSQFKPALGDSLDQVRIHVGPEASATARELGARAFTLGSQIGFAVGQYDTSSPTGLRLLAHEIGHTRQAGLHLYPDKEAKKSPSPLEQAENSLDAAFKKIDTGKPAEIAAGVTLLRKGISQLKKAATQEDDKDKRTKMQRVAKGLEALAVTVTASQKRAGATSVRETFQKKKADLLGGEEISQGKSAEASTLYRNLAQDFTDLFPAIAFESGIMLMQFSSPVQQRLDVMTAMAATGVAPKHYPPNQQDVERYFTRLGQANAKNEEITKAYADFTQAFFVHVPTSFNPTSVDPGAVYAGRQSVFGATHSDCDGFVRLGVSLLTKAGFKLEPNGIRVGIRDHKKVTGRTELFDDVHAIAVLKRNGETIYLSNQETYANQNAAFDVAWQYPDAKLYVGSGNNLKEAQEDALKKIPQK